MHTTRQMFKHRGWAWLIDSLKCLVCCYVLRFITNSCSIENNGIHMCKRCRHVMMNKLEVFQIICTYGTHQIQLKRDTRVPRVCRPRNAHALLLHACSFVCFYPYQNSCQLNHTLFLPQNTQNKYTGPMKIHVYKRILLSLPLVQRVILNLFGWNYNQQTFHYPLILKLRLMASINTLFFCYKPIQVATSAI